MNPITSVFKRIKTSLIFFIAHRGNNVSYLRSLGARMGEGCLIFTKISNFGGEPWLIEFGKQVIIA